MSNDKELTKRQTMILDYIIRQIDAKGYPPSVREIGEAVGLQSTSTVHSHLTQMERKGYIRRDPTKPRAINVLKVNRDMDDFYSELEEQTLDDIVNIPVIGEVAAGQPILASENVTDTIPLPMRFVRHDNSSCCVSKGKV